jgi:hypothetical protein
VDMGETDGCFQYLLWQSVSQADLTAGVLPHNYNHLCSPLAISEQACEVRVSRDVLGGAGVELVNSLPCQSLLRD